MNRESETIGTARLMAAPAVVLLFLVTIAPLIFSLTVSFTNLQFGTPQPLRFVGVDNYLSLVTKDFRFLGAIWRTGLFVACGLSVQVVLGYLLASLLYHIRRGRTVLLSLALIPSLISQVVSGWQGRMIFNAGYGPLNDLLNRIGIKGPAWLASQQTALVSIFITDTWQWTPFMALIILAALQSVPSDIIEAARLDGARGWTMFSAITLPIILPVTGIGILLRGVDLFKTFDLVYILTQGGPGNSSETVAYFTYLQGFKFFNPSYASAMSFIQLILVTVAAKIFLSVIRRRQES
jgi:multiple sugar transport system permease protein